MEDITKYLGLKYGFDKSQGQYHCVDVCRMWYKDHGYKHCFDDGKTDPISCEDFHKHHQTRLLRYLLKYFHKIRNADDLQHGDIVLFNVDGDLHTGVYLQNGQILAMQVPCVTNESLSAVFKRSYWQSLFFCGFRQLLNEE
jgi:putative cell-wall associated endopeptidase|uniref:Lipoprotein-like protein n=1 Tax=Myoviridae sp. ctwmI4 TaxID=2826710 RepID=A0A8S5LU99_9CAUD|nr:MAG TPA: lipoprotein-like protein [Myoviridae sp. ctwmI4]